MTMVPMGWEWTRDGRTLIEWLLDRFVKSHLFVGGATGSGKTAWLLSILCALIKRRAPVNIVFVDAKGEGANRLVGHLLPLLLPERPELLGELRHVRFFDDDFVVPLDPCVLRGGVDIATQAAGVTSGLSSLLGSGMGARMDAALTASLACVIEAGGDLLNVIEILEDDDVAARLAARLKDPERQRFLLTCLPKETPATRRALAARLRALLTLPSLRASLCAGSRVDGAELLESPLTVVNAGGAPAGELDLARTMGSLVIHSLVAAIFDRKVTSETRQVLLVLDEVAELLRGALVDDAARILELARSQKVTLILTTQSLSQLSSMSPALARSILTNTGTRVQLRGAAADFDDVVGALPITGAVVDPARPDRCLSRADEKAARVEALHRLEPRRAVVVDRVHHEVRVLDTITIPIEEAERRASQLPAAMQTALRRGAIARPRAEVLTEIERRHAAPAASAPTSAPTAMRKPSKKTPKLVIP